MRKEHCPSVFDVWTCSTVETLIRVSCDRCTQTKLSQFFLSQFIVSWFKIERHTWYLSRDTWQSLLVVLWCVCASSWNERTFTRHNVCSETSETAWMERYLLTSGCRVLVARIMRCLWTKRRPIISLSPSPPFTVRCRCRCFFRLLSVDECNYPHLYTRQWLTLRKDGHSARERSRETRDESIHQQPFARTLYATRSVN